MGRRCLAFNTVNEDKQKYYLYVTNLPAEDYTAADLAKLYQGRWEVELLYRDLKTVHGLDKIRSSKPEVVEAFILISLLLMVVTQTLRDLFIEIIEDNSSDDDSTSSSLLPRERWAMAVRRRSDRNMRRVAERLGYEPPSLVKALLNDGIDPMLIEHCYLGMWNTDHSKQISHRMGLNWLTLISPHSDICRIDR
jgi:hypothetical protein